MAVGLPRYVQANRPPGASVLQPSNVFKANNEKNKVPAVAFLPGDRYIITCCRDDCLQVIEAKTSKFVGDPWRDTAESSQVCAFAVSPDGKLVATGSKDGKIRLWMWNGKTAKIVAKSTGHPAAVNCVQWNSHGGGTHIAGGFDDGRVAVWPVPGLKNPISTHETRLRHIYAIDYSHDGTEIIVSGYDCKFSVLRVNKRGREIGLDRVRGVCSNPHQVLSVASARTTDGHVIITGSTDGKIRIRPSKNPTYELELGGHSDLVCAVVPSPDNDVLASASYDRTLRLWNLKAKRKIGLLQHSAGVSCAAFTGGGTSLATGTCDGMIYVWETSDLIQDVTNVHDNDADNEGVIVRSLDDIDVVDSTIPTRTPASHPTPRYDSHFWDIPGPSQTTEPDLKVTNNDHISDIRATRTRQFVQVAAARIGKSLKVTRTRGPAVGLGVAENIPHIQETRISRRIFRTTQRQQGIPPDSPIDQPSRVAVSVAPVPARQNTEDTSSRSISGLRLRSTRWNRVLYRVGCLAVEDD